MPPTSGQSAASQRTLAKAVDKLFSNLALSGLEGKRIYLPARTHQEDVFQRLEHDRFLVHRLTQAVVTAGGMVVDNPLDAQVAILFHTEVFGTVVTHREWRLYFYPLFLQDEEFAPISVLVAGFDMEQDRFFNLSSGRAFAVNVESYFLNLFGSQIDW